MNSAAQKQRSTSARARRAKWRFLVMLVAGLAAGWATGLWEGLIYAPAVGWAVAAGV